MYDLMDKIAEYRHLIAQTDVDKAALNSFAVLAFGINDREGVHAAERTIARMTRMDVKTVRHSLAALEAMGAISRQRVVSGGRVIGTNYGFPRCRLRSPQPQAMVEMPPPQPQAMVEMPPQTMVEFAPPIKTIENPTGQTGQIIDVECERIARQVQRASVSPWRLDTARRAVAEAIEKHGLDHVRTVAVTVAGAGLRGWEIMRRLSEPARASIHHPPEQPTTIFDTTPNTGSAKSSWMRRAIALLMAESASRRFEWYRKAQQAGCNAPMSASAVWMAAIAESYFSSEHGHEYRLAVAS